MGIGTEDVGIVISAMIEIQEDNDTNMKIKAIVIMEKAKQSLRDLGLHINEARIEGETFEHMEYPEEFTRTFEEELEVHKCVQS